MNARQIIDRIVNDGDAFGAKECIEGILYNKTGDSIKNSIPESVSRGFRAENAVQMVNEAEKSPEQKAYKALFDRILAKYGADSPNDLEASKKDDFFNEVKKAWKKDPANDNEGEGEEND